MENYLIIADDFTGSNDTGVQLTRRGFRTKVVFDASAVSNDGLSYVLDTESRNIPADEAARKTAQLLKGVDPAAFACVIKKVDSTLRGNIAQEIMETDTACGSELIVFMPALPSLGRTTVNGIHMLNGVRILDTELARDPRKPVLQDDIAEILRSVYDEPVEKLTLDAIRSGCFGFDSARIYACDAVTDSDMRAVISKAEATGKRVLWVGTAAMADNIIGLRHDSFPALAVIASVSDTARKQIRFAEEKGLTVLKYDVAGLLSGTDTVDYASEACAILSAGKDLAFVSSASYDRAELEASVSVGAAKGMSAEAVAEYACSGITGITAEILDRVKVSGLFLSGGDTAIHFFERVGAGGSEISSELSVGIPMMRLSGGRFDGLRVITKAGAFGSAEALPGIMRKLGEA